MQGVPAITTTGDAKYACVCQRCSKGAGCEAHATGLSEAQRRAGFGSSRRPYEFLKTKPTDSYSTVPAKCAIANRGGRPFFDGRAGVMRHGCLSWIALSRVTRFSSEGLGRAHSSSSIVIRPSGLPDTRATHGALSVRLICGDGTPSAA